MILTTSNELRWETLTQGTRRAQFDTVQIDVFAVATSPNTSAWRYALSNIQNNYRYFLDCGQEKTEEEAKQMAVLKARKLVHPILEE